MSTQLINQVYEVREFFFFKKICESKGVIVSVGCGMGQMEQKLRDRGKIVICVDPNNRDNIDRYTKVKRAIKEPDYAYVDDLIKAKPLIVGKVNLLLLHPLPDYALYDIQAILKLEPKKIFLSYMKEGGAGSWLLHRFLRKNNIDTQGKLKTDIMWEQRNLPRSICPIKYKYKQIFETERSDYHTYNILEKQELLTNIYTSDYSIENKEETVLSGSENLHDSFNNCLLYLTSLKCS